jgi:hypothetical protein
MLLWERLFKAMAQHGRGTARARHGICELMSAVSRRAVGDLPRFGFFRLLRGHSRSLLTRTLLPFGMFNCSDDDGDSRLYEIWTNLKVKASLSSMVMLRLHCVFFFWLSAGNNAVKFPNFEISKRKICEKCLPVIFHTSKQCVKFSFFYSCSQHIMNPVVSFYSFLLLKEGKAHIQLKHSPHNYPCWRLSRMVAAELKRGFVKLLDLQFGYFRLPRNFHEGHGTVGAW